jgi:Phosphoglycerol transferase and related proteins, alkaline phosphatase superfamily
MNSHVSPQRGSERNQSVDLVSWVLIGVTVLFAVAGLWIHFHFGGLLLDQVLLNLPFLDGTAEVGNAALAWDLVVWLVIPLVTLLAVAIAAVRHGRRTGGLEGRVSLRAISVPLLATLLSVGSFLSVTGVPQYLYSLTDSRSIEPYYRAPAIEGRPARPLNLITIYLESVENAFSQSSVFGENLLADLDAATVGWQAYPVEQPPTGGWTMAGIVATQCGVALKSDLLQAGFDPNDTGERIDTYLPGAVCLGDLLAEQGYTNTFLGGARGAFAGKEKFLSQHGYGTTLGLEYWLQHGESARDTSEWGLSDMRLFSRAAEVVDRLHAGGQPFNLTMLSLDTHEPATLLSGCAADGKEPMAAATECSMRAVAGFLGHLREAGYLKDTVVIVTGDHLKSVGTGTAFYNELSGVNGRSVLLRMWSPEPIALNATRGDQFSVLPTTLEALGFAVPDGRAGFGVSLVGRRDLTGTLLALPAQEYRSLLLAPSRTFYARLWRG